MAKCGVSDILKPVLQLFLFVRIQHRSFGPLQTANINQIRKQQRTQQRISSGRAKFEVMPLIHISAKYDICNKGLMMVAPHPQ